MTRSPICGASFAPGIIDSVGRRDRALPVPSSDSTGETQEHFDPAFGRASNSSRTLSEEAAPRRTRSGSMEVCLEKLPASGLATGHLGPRLTRPVKSSPCRTRSKMSHAQPGLPAKKQMDLQAGTSCPKSHVPPALLEKGSFDCANCAFAP